MVFLSKKLKKDKVYEADYTGGFVPADAFLIGFGLDYLGALRSKSSVKIANKKFLPSKQYLDSLYARKALLTSFLLQQNKAHDLNTTSSFQGVKNFLSTAFSLNGLKESVVSAIATAAYLLTTFELASDGAPLESRILKQALTAGAVVGGCTFFASRAITLESQVAENSLAMKRM